MNIYIGEPVEYSDMQGPCPDGFHVPLQSEWSNLISSFGSLGLSGISNFYTYLKLPNVGYRQSTSSARGQYSSWYYHSSSKYDTYYSYYIYFEGSSSRVQYGYDIGRSAGIAIRPFKNTPITPDDGWTVLYQGSGNTGIFHNPIDGLISISSDGNTWITIADKNLGATIVWNNGDECTDANCGNVFQRGNNYPFPGTWSSASITTSSDQINAGSYGPGNYYESSTWRTPTVWDNSYNYNLRGGVSQGTSTKSVEVNNIYIGEYKGWQPGSNTLAYFPLEGDYKDYSGNGNNGTKSGTINFVTSGGLTYAETSSYTAGYVSFPITMNSTAYTLSGWVNLQLPSQYFRWWSIFGIGNTTISLCGTDVGGGYNKFDVTVVGTRDGISNVAPSASTWYHIAGIFTTTGMKMYVNGAQAYSDSNSYTLSGSSGKLFSRDALTSGDYHGALSQIIIENKEWTQQEVSDYYNLTKSNYGL